MQASETDAGHREFMTISFCKSEGDQIVWWKRVFFLADLFQVLSVAVEDLRSGSSQRHALDRYGSRKQSGSTSRFHEVYF